MHRNKSQLLLLSNRMPTNTVYYSVATIRWKVMIPLNVVVLVYQKRSRGRRKRSRQGIKRAKRRPIILQMEGEEIRVAKTKAPILASLRNASLLILQTSLIIPSLMATHFHLPTSLRFEHTVHVQLLTHLPSPLTLAPPVISTLTVKISSR